MNQKQFHEIFDEVIQLQEKRLFQIAERIIPNITTDDILQPNDFPELENHPHFRYEEGVLKGMQTMRMAILSKLSEESAMPNKN